MYCKKIAVKVQHWDGPRQKKSSFFVVDVQRGEDGDVFELIGNAKVDVHSMWRLLEWQRGDFEELTLLVSIDLKYVVVANRKELHHIYDSQEHLEIELNGEVGVYGTPEGKFLPLLKMDLATDPELAEILGFRQNNIVKIPSRMDLALVFGGSLEQLAMPIEEAYEHPFKASADALILAFLANENKYLGLERHDLHRVELEAFGRSEREDWHEGGPLRLYNTKGLTFEELHQRRTRALKNRNAFWRRFPNVWDLEGEQGHDQVRRFMSKLTDDEVVELAVVVWYSTPMPGAREKLALMAASERFGHQN